MHTHLTTDLGEIDSFELKGDSGVVLVVFPAIFGVDTDIEELCHDISFEGHSVVAVDPFWNTDPGPIPHTVEGVHRAMERKRKISKQDGIAFSYACCRAVKQKYLNEKVVLLGICFGGYMAVCSLGAYLADAAVVWHGAGLVQHLDALQNIKGSLNLHFGTEDPLIPKLDREILAKVLQDKDNVRQWEYEGAKHGFTHRSGYSFDEFSFLDCMNKLSALLSTQAPS